MTPRTSVLMPAYRNEDMLRESVESALAQTVGDLEVIVVDAAWIGFCARHPLIPGPRR